METLNHAQSVIAKHGYDYSSRVVVKYTLDNGYKNWADSLSKSVYLINVVIQTCSSY